MEPPAPVAEPPAPKAKAKAVAEAPKQAPKAQAAGKAKSAPKKEDYRHCVCEMSWQEEAPERVEVVQPYDIALCFK